MSLFINEATQKSLDALLRSDAHAAILTGQPGVGLATIVKDMFGKGNSIVYTVLPEKDEKVDLEKGMITIQSIRRLYDLTKTKEPTGRLIVIDYAERMGIPAQNAFLKLLEEPIEGNRFILLTHQLESLLPTVVSRSQVVTVKPVSEAQSIALLDELKVYDSTKRTQLLFIAAGFPAELSRLVQDETYFTSRAQIVKDARTLITGNAYERLKLAYKYKDARPSATLLLEDALKLLRRSLATDGSASGLKTLTRFELIHERVVQQGNIRLQLSSTII